MSIRITRHELRAEQAGTLEGNTWDLKLGFRKERCTHREEEIEDKELRGCRSEVEVGT